MLKLIPYNFMKPSHLLRDLDRYDYVAVGEDGTPLGRGRNKEAILMTPGIHGYYNQNETASATSTPNFDEKPWGSIGEVQTVPGWPLIEPVKINRPDFVEDQLKDVIADGPRRLNEAADEAMKLVKRDPLDHDGDGKKGGSLKGSTRKKKAAK